MENLEQKLSHKKVSFAGIILIFLIFGVFGVWSVVAKLDLTVQAPGQIIVKSHPKDIQHIKGGTIDKIYVKEGDYVNKGDKLLTLDTSQIKEQLSSTKSEYQHMLASKIRIEAQLNNKKLIFPPDINTSIKKEEYKIFKNQLSNIKEKLKDFNHQINSLQENINSLISIKKTKEEILTSYQKELKDMKILYSKGFLNKDKLTDLQRKIIQIKGDIQDIEYQIKQKQSQIKDLAAKKNITLSEYKKELLAKLKDINTKLPSLHSKIEMLNTEINKSTVYAPSNGYVQNMKIHTSGEVIAPYKTIMQIIPKSDKLIIEAHISPLDIEKVKVGEKAEIMFASYVDPSAKPVEGKVIYVSHDIIKDEKNPQNSYYKAYIEITPQGLKAIKENNFKIIPGMPVTVFIKAGKRSFISYILYPLHQLLKGAFHAN
ncbi:HlyD family type I secretion periplasmic adaptor subunit [Caminibacter sp.]